MTANQDMASVWADRVERNRGNWRVGSAENYVSPTLFVSVGSVPSPWCEITTLGIDGCTHRTAIADADVAVVVAAARIAVESGTVDSRKALCRALQAAGKTPAVGGAFQPKHWAALQSAINALCY